MAVTRIPVLVGLLSVLAGCTGGGGAGDSETPSDADRAPDAAPSADAGRAIDLGAPMDGATAGDPDGGPADLACAVDTDCDGDAFCEAGTCRPPVRDPIVRGVMDGVLRAAAARFSIAPEHFERVIERASADCPQNLESRFDGQSDVPSPLDRCADGFEDTDGDGHFDAVWLADGPDHPARTSEAENPPEGRALVLQRDAEVYVLLTLDLAALAPDRVRRLTRGLALRLGLPQTRIAVQVSGARSTPDAFGLSGPSLGAAPGAEAAALRARLGTAPALLGAVPARPGVDEAWWVEVETHALEAIVQSARGLVPVGVRSANAELPMEPDPPTAGELTVPDADGDALYNEDADLRAQSARPASLSRDLRLPIQRDHRVRAVALEDAAGSSVAVLLGWGARPATVAAGVLSADFPGHARAHVEARRPGTVALWLSTAGSDEVVADRQTDIPEVDAEGQILAPQVTAAEPTRALGTLLAAAALRALDEAPPADSAPTLDVATRYVWVPITNPRIGVAGRLGVLPGFGEWLSGRTPTNVWSSVNATPACGGLGCLRLRVDRVGLGPLVLLFTPGALDEGYVSGRDEGTLLFRDARCLADLDLDGVPDADDDAVEVSTSTVGADATARVPFPVNPQRFQALPALASETVWVVGRTNGGLGSFLAPSEQINVFEGQLEPLQALARDPTTGALDLCSAGYPCEAPWTLADLVDATLAAQPMLLADLPGGSAAWMEGVAREDALELGAWKLASPDGTTRLSGESAVLGPGNKLYAPTADLYAAGVERGDILTAESVRDVVGGVLPLVLADHPNAAGIFDAMSPTAGDLVFNTACEVLYGGTCPSPRAVEPSQDPNRTLPRTPAADGQGSAHAR